MPSMTPIQSFLSDPRLTELAERCKTGDSLLSLFDLLENQHSNLLAWCLSPGEGHGLGDSVIKDLLLAASTSAAQGGEYSSFTSDFLRRWSPGRIRGTSFGSAFIVRELGVSTAGENGVQKGRLDLFLIDPINRLLVVIENKTGAALTEAQLSRYERAVKEDLKPLRAFQDFDCLLLVLDQWLDEVPSTAWVGIDYSFLESAAARAKLQAARGNAAAKLVLEYCRQHTEWESEDEEQIDELTTAIALSYPSAVEAIKAIRKQSIKDWAGSVLASDHGDLALFTKQNPELVDRLAEKSGIAAVASRIIRGSLDITNDDFLEQGRTWASFGLRLLVDVQKSEQQYWPVYLHLFRHAELSADGPDVYVARLAVLPSAISERIEPEVFIAALRRQFPKLRAKPGGPLSVITLRKGMTAEEAIKFATENLQKLHQVLLELRT